MTLAGYWAQGLQARTPEEIRLNEHRDKMFFEQSMSDLGLGKKEGETYAEWKRRLTALYIDGLKQSNDKTGIG